MTVGGERGQATLFSAVFLMALLGISTLVLDVGSWYRADRQAQSTADAVALAGAQALPDDSAAALALALEYAGKNGGGVTAADVSFSAGVVAGDTISVDFHRSAQGFFSKVIGIDSIEVHARAAARAGLPGRARWVAPMVVHYQHPMLIGCGGGPCFGPGNQTQLPYDKLGAPGAFGMINLVQGSNGTVGTSTLAEWILTGFDQYLPLGLYNSDPGAKFNSSQIRDALTARIGTVVLFPVYRTLTGSGQNAEYDIIGWVGFHLTGLDVHGTTATLDGYFTSVVWDGIQSQSASQPDFGVRAISLIE